MNSNGSIYTFRKECASQRKVIKTVQVRWVYLLDTKIMLQKYEKMDNDV